MTSIVLLRIRQYEQIKGAAEALDAMPRVGRDVFLLRSVRPVFAPAQAASAADAGPQLQLPNLEDF